jgi:hypothetical protein
MVFFEPSRSDDIPLLVGGLEHFLFSIQLGIIIPTDEVIFSQRGRSTTNQIGSSLVMAAYA